MDKNIWTQTERNEQIENNQFNSKDGNTETDK